MPETITNEQIKDTTSALLLENNLCFLLYVTSREYINRYTPALAEIGLTYTQYVTMMVLWQEKEVLTKELRDKLFLDSGTLTPVLKKLADKGLITKERSKTDARDVIVKLTETGQALKDKALEVHDRIGQSFEGLSGTAELMAQLQDMMAFFQTQRKEK